MFVFGILNYSFPHHWKEFMHEYQKCARNNSKLIWIYHGMHAMKHGKALFHKLSNMIAWFPRLIFCFIDNAIHSAIYTKSPTLNVLCNVENYAISCLGEIKVLFGITLSSAQFQTHSLLQVHMVRSSKYKSRMVAVCVRCCVCCFGLDSKAKKQTHIIRNIGFYSDIQTIGKYSKRKHSTCFVAARLYDTEACWLRKIIIIVRAQEEDMVLT